jgi:glycosyltransferase involved in cell wall biosynthesis
MKIAIVSHYFESHRGGVEIAAGGLTRALARLGHEIVWLACDATAPPPPAVVNQAAVDLPAWNLLEQRLGLPIPLPGTGAIARLFRHIRRADAVLAHDAFYPTSLLAFLAARLWRKPIVIAAHVGAIPYRRRSLRLCMALGNRLLARPLLARADRVAFVSEITRAYFETVRFRAPPVTIFNGLDTDIFRPAESTATRSAIRNTLDLPAERPVALFVGRFVEKKGLHLIERIARRRPDVFWALAGWGLIDPDSWGLANVRVFSGLSGASLAELYQASDVFVLPSIGEGYPLVIQEALACGLPVVCGDETARADPAALPFLTPVAMSRTDPDAIAADFCAAIDGILAASPGRVTDAAARHRFAAEQYSWDTCAGRYLTLIEAARVRAPHGKSQPVPACDTPPARRGGASVPQALSRRG